MANDWLDALEEKVRAAGEKMQELRAENAQLTDRVAELEARLAEAEAGASEAADSGWAEEREEIRRRVEQLTQGLEELMEV